MAIDDVEQGLGGGGGGGTTIELLLPEVLTHMLLFLPISSRVTFASCS